MRKHLIMGLILLLPLAMTIAIIGFVVNFLTKPFMGIVSHFLKQNHIVNRGFLIFTPEQTVKYTSELLILICIFFLILFIGWLGRWYLIHWLIQVGEKILQKLPFVNKVYKITKDIITHLFGHGKNTFRQVVMVPFPNPDVYALGLLSEHAPQSCNDRAKGEMISVFIPTAPNPTTGYTIMFYKHEIIYLDMKTEEALRYIVSCGVVSPKDQSLSAQKAEASLPIKEFS